MYPSFPGNKPVCIQLKQILNKAVPDCLTADVSTAKIRLDLSSDCSRINTPYLSVTFKTPLNPQWPVKIWGCRKYTMVQIFLESSTGGRHILHVAITLRFMTGGMVYASIILRRVGSGENHPIILRFHGFSYRLYLLQILDDVPVAVRTNYPFINDFLRPFSL